MEIIVLGADYSSLGLGNTRWIEQYINAGITNTLHKAALRSFYNGMVTNDLVSKFTGIHLLHTQNPALNKLNLLTPIDIAGNNRLVFVTDTAGAHTSNGYLPSETLNRYIRTEFTLNSTSDLTNLHFHTYNSTPDVLNKYTAGTYLNASGTSIFAALSRNSLSLLKGGVTTHNSIPTLLQSSAGYDLTKTGLLSLVKAGNTQYLMDAGTIVTSGTLTPAYSIGSVPQPLYFGTAGLYSTVWISSAKLSLVAYGIPSVAITTQQVATFNTLVSSLMTVLLA